MRWARYAARIGEMRTAYSILVGKPEGKDYSEELDIHGKVIIGMDLREAG
jgi:hypothetical protein